MVLMRAKELTGDFSAERSAKYPTFSVRTLLGVPTVAAVFLIPAATENRLVSCICTMAIASIAPASLAIGLMKCRNYGRSFCIGALIPMALMTLLVVIILGETITKDHIPYRVSDKLPIHPNLDLVNIGMWVGRQVGYLPVGFGIAAALAGFAAAATDALLRGTRRSNVGPRLAQPVRPEC